MTAKPAPLSRNALRRGCGWALLRANGPGRSREARWDGGGGRDGAACGSLGRLVADAAAGF